MFQDEISDDPGEAKVFQDDTPDPLGELQAFQDEIPDDPGKGKVFQDENPDPLGERSKSGPG